MRLTRILTNAAALIIVSLDAVSSIQCIQCSTFGNDAVMTKRCLDGHVTPQPCAPDKTHCLTFVEIDNFKHLQVNWRACGSKPARDARDNLSCMSYKFPARGSVNNAAYNMDNKRELGTHRQQHVREEQLHVCTASCDYDGCVLYRADVSNDAQRQFGSNIMIVFVLFYFLRI